jgi:hypothetical protein
MVRRAGARQVMEVDGDVREVGRENSQNPCPSRDDGVDVLLVRYVPRQLETVEFVGHGKQDL